MSVPQMTSSSPQTWSSPTRPDKDLHAVTDQPHYDAAVPSDTMAIDVPLAELQARDITAWFGDHMVLEQVSLTMNAGQVTALIGPSGCGKSTFLRILNRMHQLVPGAALAGEVLL